MNIEVIKNAAEWLEKPDDIIKLEKIEEVAREEKYYVTVWGHYSAGKSKLINNILNRDILPVQSRETTAVLTYIQYGTTEQCCIIYEDGTIRVKALEEVKYIFQNTTNEERINEIDHLEIYVNSEILKNGLVLVDTPGVNTIIQKHQDLAAEAMEQAGKIIYVLGGASSDVDRRFIKDIDSCGIGIVFVRTKCDRFIEQEECAEEALAMEKAEIEKFLGKDCKFIPVSNEKGNKWNENIKLLREELDRIAQSISLELKNAIEQRMKIYANSYQNELKNTCDEIRAVLEGNVKRIEDEINECKMQVEDLQEREEDLEKEVESKIKRSRRPAENDLERCINDNVEEFYNTIKNIDYGENVNQKVENIYEQSLEQTIYKMEMILNNYLDEVLQNQEVGINIDIAQFTKEEKMPTYKEIRRENNKIIEMYKARLQEVKRQLENTEKESEAVDQEAEKCRNDHDTDEKKYIEEVKRMEEELASISPVVKMRLSDEQPIQPSSVFKKIGQGIDIALLVLPGDMIVNGIKTMSDTAKVTAFLQQHKTLGKLVLGTASTVSKQANAIDKTRDFSYVVNNVIGKVPKNKAREEQRNMQEQVQGLTDNVAEKIGSTFEGYKEKKKEHNVLDMLSVAYWTEKVGACFDRKPRMEVDQVEEEEKRLKREKIEREKEELSRKRIEKKKQLKLIESKEKELKVKKEEQARKEKEIEEAMAQAQYEIELRAKKRASERYKREYREYLQKNLEKAAKMLEDSYYDSANQNIVLYIANKNATLIREKQERENQLQKLLTQKEEQAGELKKRWTTGNECLKAIKEELK